MTTTEMALTALARADAALAELAAARGDYETATNAIVRGQRGESGQVSTASHIGLTRLDELLIRRLRTLGVRAHTSEPFEATLHGTLGCKIEASTR